MKRENVSQQSFLDKVFAISRIIKVEADNTCQDLDYSRNPKTELIIV